MNKKWSLHDIKFNELKNSSSFKAERHGFHIVEPSPWPLAVSISLTNLIMLVLLYFNYFVVSWWEIIYSILLLSFSIGFWFRDIVIESTFQGMHTVIVQQMHRAGFVLVIISESFFFFWVFLMFFLHGYFTFNMNRLHMTTIWNWTNKSTWASFMEYYYFTFFWCYRNFFS
jgi:hypothetical protein